MDRRTVLSRLAREKAVIDELVSQTRDVVERSAALLSAQKTDMFLGRKKQKPLPNENEAE
jgi:hypothetical protein